MRGQGHKSSARRARIFEGGRGRQIVNDAKRGWGRARERKEKGSVDNSSGSPENSELREGVG